MTHVWQWQNRAITGYTPWRAAGESLRLIDPYYAPPGSADFFTYGYEQQAVILEDYLCFAFANPNHPRRAELRKILAPVFPGRRDRRADRSVAPRHRQNHWPGSINPRSNNCCDCHSNGTELCQRKVSISNRLAGLIRSALAVRKDAIAAVRLWCQGQE